MNQTTKQVRGIEGSETMLVTINTHTEVIQPLDPSHTHTPSYYKFQFNNRDTCSVSINGGNPILLWQGQGFTTERDDMVIESFVIVEPNVRYSWIGYR